MSRVTPHNAGQTKMLPPQVTMMTRRKSAQSQRQLRNMDRSMTKITQLLMRSPPKTAKNPTEQSVLVKTSKSFITKAKASPVKSPKKAEQHKPLPKSPVVKNNAVATLTASEYYPEKIKRTIKVEKVTLKSKSKLTKVHGLNKRKRTTPKSTKLYTIGLEETSTGLPTIRDAAIMKRIPEPSMDELMKEDSLDDEDLMEILTCPSPVWWEDPPDKSYDEDPILQKNSLIENTNDPTTLLESIKGDSIISELNTFKRNLNDKNVASVTKLNDKFSRKRTALENLLMNIKTKKIDENLGRNLKSGINNSIDECNADKKHQIDSRSESSSSEDLFVGIYEDVLNDLENIDIPIAAAVENKVNKETEMPNSVETDNTRLKNLKKDDSKQIASGIEDEYKIIVQEGDGQVPKIERKIQKSLKTLQNSSPKTLIWTSNTGDITVNEVNKETEMPNSVETDNTRLKNLKKDDSKQIASGIEDEYKIIVQEGDGQVPKIERKIQKSLKTLQNSSPKTLIWTSNTGDKKIINLIDDSKEHIGKEVKSVPSNDLNVPKQMPPLKKFTKTKEDNATSPLHDSKFENAEDDATIECSSNESDTISDTNITFLDDPEMSTDDSDRSKAVENKPVVKKVRKRKDDLKDVKGVTKTSQEINDDYLVVYKIIDGVDVQNSLKHDKLNDQTQNKQTDSLDNKRKDIATQNSNIDVFVKKCKTFYGKKDPNKTKTEMITFSKTVKVINECNSGKKKNISLSNNEVMNYCLICSSIFDTDECKYCKDKNDDENRNKRAYIVKIKCKDTAKICKDI